MASVSITHLILFIASLLVAASVAGVLTDQVSNLSHSIDQQGLDASRDVRTDVEIISDSGSPDSIYDGSTGNVTLYVKNTGSERLEASSESLDVLIDGQYESNVNVTVVDDSLWDPNDVARVVIDPTNSIQSGAHRVKVVVNGDEEVLEFRT